MSVLSTAIRSLLNKFSDSQPALQQKDLPRATSGLLLGDYIELAAAAGVAAGAAAAAASFPVGQASKTTTNASGEITVAGMTSGGGAIAHLVSTGEALTVVCGTGKITVNIIAGAAINAAAVNWVAVKLA